MKNLAFTYYYRDGARYYRAHTVVFANPTGLAPDAVAAAFTAAPHPRDLTRLMGTDAVIFDPTAFGLPEQYFDESSAADLDWHEFGAVAPTADPPTDSRPLGAFLAAVAAAPAFTFREINALGQYSRPAIG